jgi:tRNA threonylcarbamoyladenosine biosynthesis protein TsaE
LSDRLATEQLGAAIALRCPIPTVIYLEGELGTGKTTLSRGFLRALGFAGRVKSPTYTLIEPYELDRCSVYHLDLYRLSAADELEYLGARDYLHERAVWLVEWPQRGGDFLPVADLIVGLEHRAEGRAVTVRPMGVAWQRVLREVPL